MIFLTLFICFMLTILLTPLIKKLAIRIGAVDKPNQRKVHMKVMPRLGGLAIYISFIAGVLLLQPDNPHSLPILLGSLIIVLTGIIDDIRELSPRVKLIASWQPHWLSF